VKKFGPAQLLFVLLLAGILLAVVGYRF